MNSIPPPHVIDSIRNGHQDRSHQPYLRIQAPSKKRLPSKEEEAPKKKPSSNFEVDFEI